MVQNSCIFLYGRHIICPLLETMVLILKLRLNVVIRFDFQRYVSLYNPLSTFLTI